MAYREKKERNPILKFIDTALLWILITSGIARLDNAVMYSPRLQSQQEVQRIEQTISYDIKEEKKPRNYAILVGGQGILNSKWSELDHIIQRAYDNLKKRGYADGDIMVLSSTIPKNRDSNSGINVRPTPDNLKNVLDFVAENSADKDSLVFIYGGHGKFDKKKNESELMLGTKELSQKELYEHAKNIKGDKLFMITACEAGGFVDELKNLPGENVSVISLTPKEKSGYVESPVLAKKFWEGIEQGKETEDAYKDAVRAMNEKLIVKTVKKISFGKIENNPVIYERGNFQIPESRPEKVNGEYSEIEKKISESKEDTNGLETMLKKLEYALLFSFFALFVFLATATITGNIAADVSLLKSSLNVSIFLQIFLLVIMSALMITKNKIKENEEIVYHGIPLEKVLDTIESGAVLSPARIRKSGDYEFFEDVIADMGPDALKKYDGTDIDMNSYVKEHYSSLYKHGSEKTKKVLEHWNAEMKFNPDLKKMRGTELFREYALWVGVDEAWTSEAYGSGKRALFEFRLPKDSISHGLAGMLGIATGGIPLRYATKLKIEDASKKEQYEIALKKKGLGNVKVEVVS